MSSNSLRTKAVEKLTKLQEPLGLIFGGTQRNISPHWDNDPKAAGGRYDKYRWQGPLTYRHHRRDGLTSGAGDNGPQYAACLCSQPQN